MYVVAIVRLCTPIEAEAAALAEDLGTIAYEARLILNAGLPVIVLRTAEEAAANKLLAKLQARGQVAVACNSADAVPSDRMILMRQFAFEPDGIVITDREGLKLPFDDILAILRATHRTRVETVTEVKEKKFSMGRALLTGGLMMTKNVKSEENSIANETDQVLYLFRRSGGVPWLLRERGANYAALGEKLAPSSAQNFVTMIARLRALAPEAVFDERLTTQRNVGGRVAHRVTAKSESQAVSSASGVDLLAHLIALSIDPLVR